MDATYDDGSPKGNFRVTYLENGVLLYDDMPPHVTSVEEARELFVGLSQEINMDAVIIRIEKLNR